MLRTPYARCLLASARALKKQPKTRFGKYIDDIADESTHASQKTLKTVRMVGAGSVIAVICSLFWASSMSATVKEEQANAGNLAQDIRR